MSRSRDLRVMLEGVIIGVQRLGEFPRDWSAR